MTGNVAVCSVYANEPIPQDPNILIGGQAPSHFAHVALNMPRGFDSSIGGSKWLDLPVHIFIL